MGDRARDIYTLRAPEVTSALAGEDLSEHERAAGEEAGEGAQARSLEARGLLPRVEKLSERLLRDRQGAFFVKQSADRTIGLHELRTSAAVARLSDVYDLPPTSAAPVDFDLFRSSCMMYFENVGQTVESWLYEEGGAGRALVPADPDRFALAVDGIVAQLIIALFVLQRHLGFHHNDLHSRNVCLQPGTARSVSFECDGRTHCFAFPAEVPVVRFADHEFALVGAEATLGYPSCSLLPLLLSNSYNHCFDLWRFCTSTFVRRRSLHRATHAAFSGSLQLFLELFRHNKHYEESRDWFPFLATGPTPLDCLRARWEFLERFRAPAAAPRHHAAGGGAVASFAAKERRSSVAPLGSAAPWPGLRPTLAEDAAFIAETMKRRAKAANARVNARSAVRKGFALGDSSHGHKVRFLRYEIVRAQRLARALFYVAEVDPEADAAAEGAPALTKQVLLEVQKALDYDRGSRRLPLAQVLCAVPAERVSLGALERLSVDALCDLVYDARRRENYPY